MASEPELTLGMASYFGTKPVYYSELVILNFGLKLLISMARTGATPLCSTTFVM